MNLIDPIAKHFRLIDIQARALERLGLFTIGDIIFHFPVRYSDATHVKPIHALVAGESVSVYGQIKKISYGKSFRTKTAMAEATLEDPTGSIRLVWFHQPYIAKMLAEGVFAKFDGKVVGGKKGLYIGNPEFEQIPEMPLAVGDSLFNKETRATGTATGASYPIYPESRGITSKWFYHALQRILKSGVLGEINDPIPSEILDRYNLPSMGTALVWIHVPKNKNDASAARKRFAFEEVFFIQLEKQKEKVRIAGEHAWRIQKSPAEIESFVNRFPFKETNAQKKAIIAILNDFSSGRPMSRLLEGDVGSGKTAVAATTAFTVVTSRPDGQSFGTLQAAYMAPTEILATQHFESFITYFQHLPIQIALITGSGCRKFPSKVNPAGWTDISRAQLLKWVLNGEISIVIGTHALIQKSVVFKHLAYVIIDEQHRFGTEQRKKLARKDSRVPHLLSMTATPIPRTLALTIYGDLDLTLLDEMPAGRKPIITEIIPPTKRDQTYEVIRTELKKGRQMYVICPRIDEPDPLKESALNAKSVKEEAKRLKKDVFQEYEIAVLHGKMKPKDKDDIMGQFTAGDIHILVATSLIEVGVNVPNATIIIIEGAERFGLAQLHQLRGRVIRSGHQAYCFVMSETKSKKSLDRLKALTSAKNGFELAEQDLILRGAGELYGGKQWGLSDIGMEAIKNLKMVEAARAEARAIIESDPDLTKHKALAEELVSRSQAIHFE